MARPRLTRAFTLDDGNYQPIVVTEQGGGKFLTIVQGDDAIHMDKRLYRALREALHHEGID